MTVGGLKIDEEEVHDILTVPESSVAKIFFVYCFPMLVLFKYTIVDVRKKKWTNICQVMLGIFYLIKTSPWISIGHIFGTLNMIMIEGHHLQQFIPRLGACLNVVFV